MAALAERLAATYGGALDLNAGLVTAACLLHDVGKVETLPEIPGTGLLGAALDADHVTHGVLLVHLADYAESRLDGFAGHGGPGDEDGPIRPS